MESSKFSRTAIPLLAVLGVAGIVGGMLVFMNWAKTLPPPKDEDTGPPVDLVIKPQQAQTTPTALPMPKEFAGPAVAPSAAERTDFDHVFGMLAVIRLPPADRSAGASAPRPGSPLAQVDRPLMDGERAFQAVQQLAILAKLDQFQTSRLRGRLGGLAPQTEIEPFPWKKAVILKARYSPDRGEALLCVRHESPDGAHFTARWWLTHRSGVWVVFDAEDIGQGLRVSVTEAMRYACVAPDKAQVPAWSGAIAALHAVGKSLSRGDATAATEKLKGVSADGLPPALRAQRSLLAGELAVLQGQPRDALKDLDEAIHWNPDLPGQLPYRAAAHAILGEAEPAARATREFLDRIGDAETFAALAAALEKAKRSDGEIVAVCRAGLEADANNPKLGAILRRHQAAPK